ncbi:hypothetical protein [Vallitalea guaymasensis]|uniref:hypothetical protein n=1 Tax=Vallitalea guaymasensis TaxID=1185412 RepID=UPI000DE24694|nr:hypothetical protein [Vallitalea guaymasensis]
MSEYNEGSSKELTDSQKSIKKIISGFNNPYTPFRFHEDMDYVLSKDNKSLTMDEVSVKYLTNYFTLSDLFIANAIAEIEFGTKDMIYNVLQQHAKKYKDKVIPTKYDSLRGRLSTLTQSNIVRRFRYTTSNKENVSVFTLTAIGYNFVKKICNFKKNYDPLSSVFPVDEIVKSLAAINVMLKFTKYSSFIEYETNQNYYEKTIGRNKLYGEVKTQVGDHRYYILLEPMYFRYNSYRISGEEIEKNIKHRINLIKAYCSNRTAKGTPIIIFVCEDKEGLKKAMIHTKKELVNFLGRIYFTSDSVVFKNDGILNSLLNINQKGDVTDELKQNFF